MRKGMELESPSDGVRLQEEVRSTEGRMDRGTRRRKRTKKNGVGDCVSSGT